MTTTPSPRARWPETTEPAPTRETTRRRGRRGRSAVASYVLGAAIGLVVGPIVIGGVWMLVLFYAEWLGDFDTKNDRISEVIAGTVLGAPLIGLLAGIVVVAWRRHRAARAARVARTARRRSV